MSSLHGVWSAMGGGGDIRDGAVLEDNVGVLTCTPCAVHFNCYEIVHTPHHLSASKMHIRRENSLKVNIKKREMTTSPDQFVHVHDVLQQALHDTCSKVFYYYVLIRYCKG